MCYYTQSYVHCGHPKKIPFDPSDCICKRIDKTKPSDAVDATGNDSEGSKKRKHGKDYGDFRGELKPLKESWCPSCLVEQKAKIIDQISAEGIGSILKQIVSPDEPQPKPTKIKQPRQVGEKSEAPMARAAAQTPAHTPQSSLPMIKAKPAIQTSPRTSGSHKETPITIQEDGLFKVPQWGTKWDGKSRGDMKHEFREGKMEMVDQIRVLRDIAKANGMKMDELEQKVKTQTDERRAEEQKKKDAAQRVRNDQIDKTSKLTNEERIKKAEKKAERIQEHLMREAERKAKILYRL